MSPQHSPNYYLKLTALVAVLFGVAVVFANYVGGVYLALSAAILVTVIVVVAGRLKAMSESRQTRREFEGVWREVSSDFDRRRRKFDEIGSPDGSGGSSYLQ